MFYIETGYRDIDRCGALDACPKGDEASRVVLVGRDVSLSSAVLPVSVSVSVSVSVNVSAHVRIAYKISKIYEQVSHPPCGFVCNIQYQALSGLLVSTVPIELRESSATASALVFNALGR